MLRQSISHPRPLPLFSLSDRIMFFLQTGTTKVSCKSPSFLIMWKTFSTNKSKVRYSSTILQSLHFLLFFRHVFPVRPFPPKPFERSHPEFQQPKLCENDLDGKNA